MVQPTPWAWVLAALFTLPQSQSAWAQQRPSSSRHYAARDRARHASRETKGQQTAQQTPPATASPAPAVAPVVPSLPITGERPFVAIRVDCNDGLPSPLCTAVLQAATEAVSKSYRVVEQVKVESVLNREPALRPCRRQDCRVAITDSVGAAKLLDVSISNQGRRVVGSVSIYDAVVKDISGDTEIAPTHREEKDLRKAIASAVDYVIGAQRLTALLRLDIKPEGARVKIDDVDRGTVREVRLFLGPHKVTVEKLGYIPDSRTVNVSPAGASVEIALQQQPLPVRFQWSPQSARAMVDGDLLDAARPVADLTEGKHRLQLLPELGSGYDAKECEFEVRPAMKQPVSCNAPLLAQIRITLPIGYSARVDNQKVESNATVRGDTQELMVPVSAGQRMVTSVSHRERERSLVAQTFAGRQTELVIRPPTLVPGLVLASLGLVSVGAGAWLVAIDGANSRPDTRQFVWDTSTGGAVMLGVGAAALVGGTFWFVYNALDHPFFYRRSLKAKTAGRSQVAWVPVVTSEGGALLAGGRF